MEKFSPPRPPPSTLLRLVLKKGILIRFRNGMTPARNWEDIYSMDVFTRQTIKIIRKNTLSWIFLYISNISKRFLESIIFKELLVEDTFRWRSSFLFSVNVLSSTFNVQVNWDYVKVFNPKLFLLEIKIHLTAI